MIFAFMSEISSVPEYLKILPASQEQIIYSKVLPARDAVHSNLKNSLQPSLEKRLEKLGLLPLYLHQALAVDKILEGNNVIVSTPSASGKSLCYHIPVLNSLLQDKNSCAFYVFPTKALAQDQLKSLIELASPSLLKANEMAAFDGDTLPEERAVIKKTARIILTNPDMLHVGILPNHATWSAFMRRLRYVVVDEAHIYRGVFGSHVAQVLRRLRRLCGLYGAKPVFISCSATIANPGEHAERLVGLPFSVVNEDSSPHGSKHFVFWNPPITDKLKNLRRSPLGESSMILAELVKNNIRTLVFSHTRKTTELIYIYTRDRLKKEFSELAERLSPYRAGYLPHERRRIEQELFRGKLLGVVATSALELGLDIGDLEATVLTGYPGNLSSAWQQAGRSGRRKGFSLSVLIGANNPLDQYLMTHPDYFFTKPYEHAFINTDNLYILKPHILCAAWERTLEERDGQYFGPLFKEAVQELEKEGLLKQARNRWFLSPRVHYPAQEINLRTASAESYAIINSEKGFELLEVVEASRAFLQAHQGAIYLHQGEPYEIKRLDLDNHIAYAVPTEADYYTQTKELTDISIMEELKEKQAGGVSVYRGKVEVSNQVISFVRKKQFTEEIINEEFLDLPEQKYITAALWFDIPEEALRDLVRQGMDPAGGLHALEHAAIGLLPLFALCDRNDIGGVSTPMHSQTGKPEIFIYDGYPGGIGITEKGYELIKELWLATEKAIADCPCEEGCPACIQSPKCGNNNEPLDKKAALHLLKLLNR